MEYMYELKDMLCEELEHIAEKGELTAGSLDTIQKLTHSLKSIETIMAMNDEYSYEYGGNMGGGNSNRGGSYGNSYARRRYSRENRNGYSRRRYSRDDEMSKMVEKLEKMMNQTNDQNARNAIEQAIEMMEQ